MSRFGTRDPYEIARALGIGVSTDDIGSLRGFYTSIKRNRFIVIGSGQSFVMKRIVCAHELGHDRLHRDMAGATSFREFMIYRMDSRPEYEANVFAAALLLDEERLVELARDGLDVSQIAAEMGSDTNLVAIRASALNMRGISLRAPEFRSDFLKKGY